MLPHLRVGNAQPDLTLLVVGAWSLRRGVEEGAVWAVVGGIVLDLMSAGPFSALVFGLLAAPLKTGSHGAQMDTATGMAMRSI